MFRAKLSVRLSNFVLKTLPDSVARTLGLRIPTTPAALASVVMAMAYPAMESLKRDVVTHHISIERLDEDKVEAAAVEMACALYCLAVNVLAQDGKGCAADQTLFQVYTAMTFDWLQRLLPRGGRDVPLERLVDECTELYLHDRPDLAEFSKTMVDYIFDYTELQPAIAKNDWGGTFYLKAKTRILWRLGVSKRVLDYNILSISLGHSLLTAVRMFKRLRPVFDETNA